MTDWKNIHPDFTESLQKQWEDKGFSFEQVKELSSILGKRKNFFGAWLYDFYSWLRDAKHLTTAEISKCSYDDYWNLRNEHGWQTAHGLTLELMREWKFEGFDGLNYRRWINRGLLPIEAELASYLTKLGYYPESKDFEVEKSRTEYVNWKDTKFASASIIRWQNRGFTVQQCKEWINIGLKQTDYDYAHWLKDIKKENPSSMTHSSCQALRQEYKNWLEKEKNNPELSSEVIEQIKNISPWPTPKQELLIESLIPNIELRKRYRAYGLCGECQQPNAGEYWCQVCYFPRFRENFQNWSGSPAIDKFIKERQLKATNVYEILEWIPYEQFTNVEYLAEGGFGKIYKAEWIDGPIIEWSIEKSSWVRDNNKEIVLKSLNNSQNLMVDFLREITNYKSLGGNFIVQCYGISQDPKTKNYVMVMEYMEAGDLRNYLQNWVCWRSELNFAEKLKDLEFIASGLEAIHKKGLIHRDLHAGNILFSTAVGSITSYIADLGLCQPANEASENKIYGVLPYVAPELLEFLLNPKPDTPAPYSQSSDIYSFGMVAYEMLSGLPPFHDREHNLDLAMKIRQGLRPQFQIKIPESLEELINECWDTNHLWRPMAEDLYKILKDWNREIENVYWGRETEFTREVKEVEKFNKEKEKERYCKSLSRLYQQYKGQTIEVEPEKSWKVEKELFSHFCQLHSYDERKYEGWEEFIELLTTTYQVHPLAVYTSRLLDFKNLSKPVNSKAINEQFWGSRLLNTVSIPLENFNEKNGVSGKRQLSISSQNNNTQKKSKMSKVDWTVIHRDFTPALKKEWVDWGFTLETAKEWIDTNFIKPTEVGYVQWLKNWEHKTIKDFLSYDDKESLRKKYEKHLDWYKKINNKKSIYYPSDYVISLREKQFQAQIQIPLEQNQIQTRDNQISKKKEEEVKQTKINKEELNDNNWFKSGRWLTDREIDWTLEKVINTLRSPYEQISKFKILELTQFMFAKEANQKDLEAAISFPVLLSELTGFNGDLVFIPINNPDFHWSLLVYEKGSQTFYHWDTLRGNPNHGYIKPLVKDLLQQLHQNNNPDLEKYLILRNEIIQPNTWDCGIAVIEITKRIMEKYNGSLEGINLGKFDFPQARINWRSEYENEQTGQISVEYQAQVQIPPK